MSGARADFIASLGRKVSEARDLLSRIEANLGHEEEREDLVRRLQTLGTSARMLQFPRVAEALAEAQATLERGTDSGGASFKSLEAVGRILDDLPALAWDVENRPSDLALPMSDPEPEDPEPAPEPELPVVGPIGVPLTVLVVGPESLAETVLEESEARSARTVEIEREATARGARDMTRALAPDVLILDAAVAGGEELVEALADDPLTEPVPIVVVGDLDKARASRFLALGVQRTLVAPYSGEVLLRTCEEVVDQRIGRTARIALGDPTVEQLGQRLADEVYRAIVTGIPPSSRAQHVALGEGTEVLAAVWGAIARVREIVTVRTGGAVRFPMPGPEGATALAPWMDPEVAGADRARVRGRGAGADVRLEGRRVVVADDDPGVTWYIADLLRTTGCIVHEALDGKSALELAQKTTPDLVISDILMPELDGFGLCRSLRRDVALRDVPVILLSWKEDLLQRVRELGASAAAYLRKESDARAILARVREVLWPRARIEARLKGTGEVRGRLEGLTVRTLLELVGSVRQNARVSVRDASSLFEIEIQNGAPRRATLTSGDGGFARGERVLASMLGVGAGRFVVGPASTGVSGELSGSLAQLLEKPIAQARGALAAVSGAKGVVAARVVLDSDVLEQYLHATPEPMRGLVLRLAQGASPRELLLAGAFAATLLEDVLADLAARGAIVGVQDDHGADLLGPEVSSALAILRAAPPRVTTPFSSLRVSRPPSRPPQSARAAARPASRAPVPQPEAAPVAPAPPAPPSSLADAVMRELSERAPGSGTPAPPPAPIVEPAELKPRSNPPEEGEPFELRSAPPSASTPVLEELSLDADEVLELRRVLEDMDATDVAAAPVIEPTPSPRLTPSPTELEAVYDLTSGEPARAELDDDLEELSADELEPDDSKPTKAEEPERPRAEAKRADEPKAERSEPQRSKPRKVATPAPPPAAAKAEPAKGSTGIGWFLLLAALVFGGIFAKLAFTTDATPAGNYVDPPAGVELRADEGVLQIDGAGDAEVLVDGSPRGRGPNVRVTLPMGPHEVRVGVTLRRVQVQAGRMVVLDVTSP